MKEFLAALLVVGMMWLLVVMAVTTPIGFYADGRCVAVENRAGRLVRCEGAPRHEPVVVVSGTTFETLLTQRFEAAVARGDVTELFPEL